MTLQDLFSTLKGSHSSGNFGHSGRPGKEGGSGTGGGHARIGITSKPGADRNFDVHMYRLDRTGKKPAEKKIEEKKSYSFANTDELAKHYKAEDLCKAMPKECSHINDYTGSGYELINTRLREGKIPRQEVIDAIDKMIDQAPRAPKDIVVKRVINGNDLFNKLQVGGTFEDKAYVSTTADKKNELGLIADDQAHMFHIRVPKGSKSLYVEKISDVAYEKELLLPRGSKFKIISKGDPSILELING